MGRDMWEKTCETCLPLESGIMERCVELLVVLDVHLGAALQKLLAHVLVPLLRREVQRRDAIHRSHVQISARVAERHESVQVASPCGEVERSATVLVGRLDSVRVRGERRLER